MLQSQNYHVQTISLIELANDHTFISTTVIGWFARETPMATCIGHTRISASLPKITTKKRLHEVSHIMYQVPGTE